jgi:chaperonin cofactor prefoldin
MLFIIVLAITTFAIASSAAFFSVYGLAHLFAGAMIPIIIMGSTLEAGKLVAASFLYRYFNKIGFSLKAYLISSVAILMLITSMGIFGFLVSAYQTDTLPIKEMQQKISMLETESNRLYDRKTQIDSQIEKVGANYVRAKTKLSKEFSEEKSNIDKRLSEIEPELQELKTKNINVQSKIGPIIFVADVLGKDPNTAIFWFIIILISVFDPLAVALTIALNIAIKLRREENDIKEGGRHNVNMNSLKSYIDSQVNKIAGSNSSNE